MGERLTKLKLRNIFKKACTEIERFWLQLIVEVRGVSGAVRYLRNPNPGFSIPLLKRFGAKVGEGTTVKQSLSLDNVERDGNSAGDFRHLEIGRNCYVGDEVYIDLANRVFLGSDSILSGRVSILTHADCNRSSFLSHRFPRECNPVRISEGAWVGFGATITSGTTVGKKSVVAAHSLVLDDLEPKCLYAGVPASKVRELDK